MPDFTDINVVCEIALKDETLRRLQVLVARDTKVAKPTYVVDFI